MPSEEYEKFKINILNKYQKLINEIEFLSNKHKKDCNNYTHLVSKVKSELSKDYNNFIFSYAMSYGLDEFIGTEFYYQSAVLSTELSYKLLKYPLTYSKSLFQ